jgi:hypothetical protein
MVNIVPWCLPPCMSTSSIDGKRQLLCAYCIVFLLMFGFVDQDWPRKGSDSHCYRGRQQRHLGYVCSQEAETVVEVGC